MKVLRAAPLLGILILSLTWAMALAGKLNAQGSVGAAHEQITGVACEDTPADQKRPPFGCFNIATEAGLKFSESEVYWHLRTFPTRAVAEARKSESGIVVEEDGRVWLSDIGPRDLLLRGGQPVASSVP